MACICGSLRRQEKEKDDYDLLCPTTSPRKPTRRRNIFGIKSKKTTTNLYSDRGLDKFEALLADLNHKRQKILTQKGAEDITMVRFIYPTPTEVKPIVVKLRDHRTHNNTSPLENSQEFEGQKDVDFCKGNNNEKEAEEGKIITPLVVGECKNTIKFDQWRRMIGEWWKPSYYFVLFMILILVLLMFSGRSFAILCTVFGWYLVPIINERSHDSKQPKKIIKKNRVLDQKVKMNR